VRPPFPAALRLLSLSVLILLAVVPAALAKPAAGPEVIDCAKAQKKAACLKQNKANQIAFDQIKDSTFVGTRGDGESVEATFCANGKFEDNVGGGISTGSRWQIVDAIVTQGGKSIKAFVEGTGGFEIALLKQGAQWKFGVASLGRVLYPGNVTRSSGAATCKTL
jgi:hypothetical protein